MGNETLFIQLLKSPGRYKTAQERKQAELDCKRMLRARITVLLDAQPPSQGGPELERIKVHRKVLQPFRDHPELFDYLGFLQLAAALDWAKLRGDSAYRTAHKGANCDLVIMGELPMLDGLSQPDYNLLVALVKDYCRAVKFWHDLYRERELQTHALLAIDNILRRYQQELEADLLVKQDSPVFMESIGIVEDARQRLHRIDACLADPPADESFAREIRLCVEREEPLLLIAGARGHDDLLTSIANALNSRKLSGFQFSSSPFLTATGIALKQSPFQQATRIYPLNGEMTITQEAYLRAKQSQRLKTLFSEAAPAPASLAS